MKPRVSRICLILCILFAIASISTHAAVPEAEQKGYYRIVTLADLHLPGRNTTNKFKAQEIINSWSDVDYVALLGDLVSDVGNAAEYEYAEDFVSKFAHPVLPIVGNHDYIYLDKKNSSGGRERGMFDDRQRKLDTFKQTYGLESVYYSIELKPYFLVFLSTDDLYSSYLARLSSDQIAWFEAELESHKDMPTIVFFHSPLKGTLIKGNGPAMNPDFWAQPVQTIHDILANNEQVIAWVSGHTHIAPSNRNFYDPESTMYDGRVLNVHTPDFNGSGFISEIEWSTQKHNDVFINSLYLYPDRVVIRTYDAMKRVWLEDLDREVVLPTV